MSKFPRLKILLSPRPLSTALFFAAPLAAGASVLGEPVWTSAVGEPLRVEIAVLDGDVSRAPECLRIVPGDSEDGLPWVRDGRIAAIGRGTSARIAIESATPAFEPVLKLALQDVCDTRLRREYTLLLSFPDAPRAPEFAASPAPPSPVATPRVARAPGTERLRARSGSPAQTAPDAVTPPVRRPRPRPAATETPAADSPAPRPTDQNDRLVLGASDSLVGDGLRLSTELASFGRIGTTSDAEREQLRREQYVVMAVDRTIVAQLELNERIRQLEETQRRLVEHARAAAAPTAAGAAPATATNGPDRRDWLYFGAILAGLSLLLAAGLLALRRRTHRDADVASLPPPEPLTSAPVRVEPAEHRASPEWARAAAARASGGESGPANVIAEGIAARPDWSAEPIAASTLPDEEAAEEHESAIELAEIMMGFGRVQGAAETLAEFIQSNPKKAITPWLKLLEVYRAAGLRPEFDAVARQLNKTFNVKAVTWETFDEARAAHNTIEQMPHVTNTLTQLWGTTDCQAYLEKLLRDNRDGTREGFPLSVIDEILVLASMLEDELGAYRVQEPASSDIAA